ncbi:MAG TPA: beta-ketoacyl-ACP synthase II [Thermoanaerobaculia bacterium]|nr:beta-ketoacyl-ACP synthase II [Thermoanaerobaculia bacterium]
MPRRGPSRRVAVTGVGLVSPLGIGTHENWEALKAGRSGIGPITRFDASQYPVRIAGEVKGFDPSLYVSKKDIKKMDTFIHYGMGATHYALEDAGFRITPENAERVAVVIGSGIGGLPLIESQHRRVWEGGPDRFSPFFIPGLIANMTAGQVSIKYGAKGPNLATITACTTGAHAIGEAYRMIQYGDADAAITGGTEAVITPLAVGGFAAMRALSTRNDEPQRASRPWDKGRDGFVIGEGAGVLVLEEWESAKARGANVYAEMVGYGMSGDAYHISAPSEDGDGPARVMRNTLADAEVNAEQVDYINAHGTSTPMGDRVETIAVKRVFGDHAKKVAISSTKSMTGHLLGAAGGLEMGILALTVKHGVIPPTINYEEPDPECDLDYVPNTAREVDVRYALSNSFGFGGTNGCLLLKKV